MLQRSDSLDHSTALSLDNIRQSLIRQEDTIIFSLIERAQFAANEPVYQSGAIAVPGKHTPTLQCMTFLPVHICHMSVACTSLVLLCEEFRQEATMSPSAMQRVTGNTV